MLYLGNKGLYLTWINAECECYALDASVNISLPILCAGLCHF